MGREIRRVPPDWEHPRYTGEDAPHQHMVGDYRPCVDEDYTTACVEWYEGAVKFIHTEYSRWYHEYAGDPPDSEFYRDRKWTEEEATHYQVYQNVSEGTPVTPHFATKEEIIDYLVTNGDFWDQKRGHGGWNRSAAESFVKNEYAPSMIAIVADGKVDIQEPRDMNDLE